MLCPPAHPLAADDPFFALVLRTPRLVLRPAWDEDIVGLTEAALSGIHPENEMPFARPWSREPRPELYRGTAASIWRERASRTPADWGISFAVREADGDSEWFTSPVIGRQDLLATDFLTLRSIHSGSWLAQSAQGRGLGLEMRQAILMWAFDHLGATEAVSGAYAWNHKSLGVSRRAGYTLNGTRRVNLEDTPWVEQLVRMDATDLVRPEWQLEAHGTEGVREVLGITD